MKDAGPQSQTVTQTVDIPEFLKPLASNQALTSGISLSNLRNLLGNAGARDLVAPFNQSQIQGFRLGQDFALGRDGLLPAAQNTLLGATQGQGLSSFLDPTALSALTGSAQGQGLESFLPAMTLQALQQGAQGGGLPGAAMGALTGAVQRDPFSATGFVPQQALSTLSNFAQGSQLSPDAINTLQRTAQGDFLFGGEGFDAAVDAAVRAAQPHIVSTFGRGGAGAATGGLAQAAIGQAAADAFAGQFAQERANQLSAANALGNLGLAGQQQQIGAAQALGGLGTNLANIGLAGQNQQLQAAGLLGDLGLSGMGQQLQAAGLLGDFASQERARQLSSAGQLAGLSDAERQRQLSAAGLLPSLGTIGADIMTRIGSQIQGQSQQELAAPILAQQQLLAAAGGGLPLGALFGSTQSQPLHSNPLGNFLGMASTGLGLANAFAPAGATGLAAFGGPLGLGLALGIPLLGSLFD